MLPPILYRMACAANNEVGIPAATQKATRPLRNKYKMSTTNNLKTVVKMLRTKILIFLLISLFVKSYAQYPYWDTISMKASVRLMDICILPDGLHGWAVGTTEASGEVLTSIIATQDGENWEEINFPYAGSVTLNSVFFITADSGWVVGDNGIIYATTDGGQSWIQQYSGTSRKLAKVQFLDNMNGWITGGWQDGTSFLVLKTTDGGNTWQNKSFGSTCFSCLDIYFTDEMNGWICGDDIELNPHIHHTSDGGMTWESQTVPEGAGSPSSIGFANANEGWITTSSIYLTPMGAILHTTDGGENWEIQFNTNMPYNDCIDVKDEQHVALASVDIFSSPESEKVFVTSNGGETWNNSLTPVVDYTFGIQYKGDDIWFATNYSQILHSSDNGESWEWVYKSSLFRSIAWSNSMNGWIVSGTSAGNDGYCVRTTDGGETWFYDENVPGGSQVLFYDENNGWMFFEGNTSKIWHTTDGGQNWEQHNIYSGGKWLGNIFFVNQNKGWAYGSDGAIKVTNDGGVTWSNQNCNTSDYIATVFFVDENEGWAAGGYGGANGFIRHTTDGGNTWETQTPANDNHFQVSWFVNNQTGLMVAVNGKVHKTTDGGQSWQVISQLDHDYTEFLIMEDELTGYLAMRNFYGSSYGDDGRGFIYKTNDGGESWELEWSGPWIKSSISSLAYQSPGNLWACGAHNTILEHVSEPIGFKEITIENPNVKLSPNPFSSQLKIICHNELNGSVSVLISDINGRVVNQLYKGYKPAGEFEIKWDGTDNTGNILPAGTYFCTFINGRNMKRTVKILKLQ